eukprot:CAMPEP_0202081014 /NCGR_PEP_ID=MMETSP0964-20121228/11844_1 /ASSEMBLY_ACC=CAM_ASM_000500 /TAXON_ID=4773 /ORGANISM="Schizochytrium aggregatum, Strain ATCC28209" /LENGTH=629 /DNA_ID=CAMNT_0048648519 /DNA_START=79 /DNA_END=1968 /DNA_ORIENTATION=-
MSDSKRVSPLRQPLIRGSDQEREKEGDADSDSSNDGRAVEARVSRGRLRSPEHITRRRQSAGFVEDYEHEDEEIEDEMEDEEEHSDGSEKYRAPVRPKYGFYLSDGALSEDERRQRASGSVNRTRGAIQKRLPMIPSRARFPTTSAKRAAGLVATSATKLPRKIPRRVKGKYRRIVAEREDEIAIGRIAVHCPSNELDLDAVYARLLAVRQENGSSDHGLPLVAGGTEFSIETNKTMIVPTILVDSHRSSRLGAFESPGRLSHDRNSIDSPTWSASIFFDVLHLRQRIDHPSKTQIANAVQRRNSSLEQSELVGEGASAATMPLSAADSSKVDASSPKSSFNNSESATGSASTQASVGQSKSTASQADANVRNELHRHFSETENGIFGEDFEDYREVFLFGFGGIVFWNWDGPDSEQRFVRSLRPFARRHYEAEAAESASDDLEYYYGKKSSVRHDTVELASNDPIERLAYSFAIAQSSLLSVYEFRLDQIIERNEHIPVTLARYGKIHMSQEEISKEIGLLFMERNMINLESDIITTPEIFWENDEWEPIYKRMCNYMEHDERHDILNKRLDCVRELLDVLSSQVENQHASKLEWIIIWLICSEVAVQVIWGVIIKDILGFFNHCDSD